MADAKTKSGIQADGTWLWERVKEPAPDSKAINDGNRYFEDVERIQTDKVCYIIAAKPRKTMILGVESDADDYRVFICKSFDAPDSQQESLNSTINGMNVGCIFHGFYADILPRLKELVAGHYHNGDFSTPYLGVKHLPAIDGAK